jgi:hypothetical protein
VPSVISIHHLTRYALLLSLLGAQPWDDWMFRSQGNIWQGNQVNMVEWPITPFPRRSVVHHGDDSAYA